VQNSHLRQIGGSPDSMSLHFQSLRPESGAYVMHQVFDYVQLNQPRGGLVFFREVAVRPRGFGVVSVCTFAMTP
jgi:hypothetical protein